VTDVAGRSADELRHLVVGLVLGTVDLEELFRAAVQDVGDRLDGAGLAGPRRTQQQEDADRPVRRIQPRLVHLDARNDVLQGARLADNLPRQQLDEVTERRPRMLRSSGVHNANPRQRV
jgi:hypothetical protein